MPVHGADLITESAGGIVDALIGEGPRRRVAASPVSLWAIRAWCNAVGLRDPHHAGLGRDPAERPAAPPPMLQCWAGQGLAPADGVIVRALHHDVRQAFRAAGFGSVVATAYEQHYLADLHVGDVVEELSWIESVSPLKSTRLGTGHFVRIMFEFRDRARDILVGRQIATTFYFRPASDGKAATPAALPPAGEHPLVIELTPTLIIAGSIASNDYERVHHDLSSARGDGLPDIIASIITSAGLVARYLLDHARPHHALKSLDLRLGTPACPGDRLTLSLEPVRRDGEDEHVRVVGTTDRGIHLDARLAIAPRAPG